MRDIILVMKVSTMGNVRITIPDQLHKDLKHISIDEKMALKELIVKALQKYRDGKRNQRNNSAVN